MKDEVTSSKPKFPYTPNPADLRKLLTLIPNKPKPGHLKMPTVKTWGIKGGQVTYAIGVLREIGLIDPSGAPTDSYVAYMMKDVGGKALGNSIKERYSQLFELHQSPQNASDEDLQNFFHIHSGGAETTIKHQIRTFKALCEFAIFDDTYKPVGKVGVTGAGSKPGSENVPTIHFDFHLHLPEGKTSSEYESIIKAISEHIIAKMRG